MSGRYNLKHYKGEINRLPTPDNARARRCREILMSLFPDIYDRKKHDQCCADITTMGVFYNDEDLVRPIPTKKWDKDWVHTMHNTIVWHFRTYMKTDSEIADFYAVCEDLGIEEPVETDGVFRVTSREKSGTEVSDLLNNPIEVIRKEKGFAASSDEERSSSSNFGRGRGTSAQGRGRGRGEPSSRGRGPPPGSQQIGNQQSTRPKAWSQGPNIWAQQQQPTKSEGWPQAQSPLQPLKCAESVQPQQKSPVPQEWPQLHSPQQAKGVRGWSEPQRSEGSGVGKIQKQKEPVREHGAKKGAQQKSSQAEPPMRRDDPSYRMAVPPRRNDKTQGRNDRKEYGSFDAIHDDDLEADLALLKKYNRWRPFEEFSTLELESTYEALQNSEVDPRKFIAHSLRVCNADIIGSIKTKVSSGRDVCFGNEDLKEPLVVYKECKFVGIRLNKSSGCSVLCNFTPYPVGQGAPVFEREEFLKFRNLVLLTCDAFETIHYAEVMSADVNLLHAGFVTLRFLDPESFRYLYGRAGVTMVECPAYWVQYKEIIRVLTNRIRDKDLARSPIYATMVHGDKEAQGEGVKTTQEESEGLEQNQVKAMERCLGFNFAMVQGAPGTGKTTTVCKIIKAMLSRKQLTSTPAEQDPKAKLIQDEIRKYRAAFDALDDVNPEKARHQYEGLKVQLEKLHQSQCANNYNQCKKRHEKQSELPRVRPIVVLALKNGSLDWLLKKLVFEVTDNVVRVGMRCGDHDLHSYNYTYLKECVQDELEAQQKPWKDGGGRFHLSKMFKNFKKQMRPEYSPPQVSSQAEDSEEEDSPEDHIANLEDTVRSIFELNATKSVETIKRECKYDISEDYKWLSSVIAYRARTVQKAASQPDDQPPTCDNDPWSGDGAIEELSMRTPAANLIKQEARGVYEYIPLGADLAPPDHDLGEDVSEWVALQFSYKESALAKLDTIVEYMKQINSAISNGNDEFMAETLKTKYVIGMTTTSFMANIRALERVNPEAILLEESGELLEYQTIACILPKLNKLVLFGDHQQLRPIPLSQGSLAKDMTYSLMERLFKSSKFTRTQIQLNIQFRMHPSIAGLINGQYASGFDNSAVVKSRGFVQAIPGRIPRCIHSNHICGFGPRVQVFDPIKGAAKTIGSSLVNEYDANQIVNILRRLIFHCGIHYTSITVLTLYRKQVGQMKVKLRSTKITQLESVEVTTVDAFQGRENDFTIISTVVSKATKATEEDFVGLMNRVIVAASRSRHGLIIVGAMEPLRKYKSWDVLMAKAEKMSSEREAIIHRESMPINCAICNSLLEEAPALNKPQFCDRREKKEAKREAHAKLKEHYPTFETHRVHVVRKWGLDRDKMDLVNEAILHEHWKCHYTAECEYLTKGESSHLRPLLRKQGEKVICWYCEAEFQADSDGECTCNACGNVQLILPVSDEQSLHGDIPCGICGLTGNQRAVFQRCTLLTHKCVKDGSGESETQVTATPPERPTEVVSAQEVSVDSVDDGSPATEPTVAATQATSAKGKQKRRAQREQLAFSDSDG